MGPYVRILTAVAGIAGACYGSCSGANVRITGNTLQTGPCIARCRSENVALSFARVDASHIEAVEAEVLPDGAVIACTPLNLNALALRHLNDGRSRFAEDGRSLVVFWHFKTGGTMYRVELRSRALAPNKSLERTREG